MTCNECANSKLRKLDPALPLMKTVERGHYRCLDAMIKRGDDINRKNLSGMSILMHTATCTSKNNMKCVRTLVHGGADVNAVSDDIRSTALMFAAKNGNIDCLAYLIRKGADVNVRSGMGMTALMYVAFHGNITLAVLALLRANTNINVCDKDGQNAIQTHLANHRYVNSKLIMLLIAAGEELDGMATFKTDKARQQATYSKPLLEYLREQEGNICLTQMCRKVIRGRLLKINPNQHLFYRVPELGLSAILTDYLLYNLSVEKTKYEGVDEETEEEEQSDDDDGQEQKIEKKEVVRHQKLNRNYQSDSDYDPENDEDAEDIESEEEWENESQSDDHDNNRRDNRIIYREDHDDSQSFEEEGGEPEDPNDEDYDPEKGNDSGEDESSTEESEEDEIEDESDTVDTSDDSSDSDETESDD